MVWKAATKVGFGIATVDECIPETDCTRCPDDSPDWLDNAKLSACLDCEVEWVLMMCDLFVVARYDKPQLKGVAAYETNVLPEGSVWTCEDGPDPNGWCHDGNSGFCTSPAYQQYFTTNCKIMCGSC